ncbi:MAG: RnfABCDGE type electron transport complex subunit G [Candidatus Omnitrophica bacterium]|nr:RnfABCDGE type electron transport complex subunit G [Candidatus Omnitrophota bacterium]
MKEMIRYACILAVICCLASGLLAGVNALTKPRILALAYAAQQEALAEVVEGAADFEPVASEGDEAAYYKAYDADKNLIGVAFKAEGKGYAGVIETMAGMSPDGRILAIKVMSQNETPGLGSLVTEEQFREKFKGRAAVDLAEVEGITGATISSRAVISSVQETAEKVMRLLEHE